MDRHHRWCSTGYGSRDRVGVYNRAFVFAYYFVVRVRIKGSWFVGAITTFRRGARSRLRFTLEARSR